MDAKYKWFTVLTKETEKNCCQELPNRYMLFSLSSALRFKTSIHLQTAQTPATFCVIDVEERETSRAEQDNQNYANLPSYHAQ